VRIVLISAIVLLAACGEGTTDFTACGGDVTGTWNFTGATVANACSTETPAITGFAAFNANGHYSISGNVKAWKLHGAEPCGFDTVHAGFWKQVGSRICIAESPAELDSQPCDETAHTLDKPWSAAADVCIEAATLTLSTSSLFGLNQAATLTLTK